MKVRQGFVSNSSSSSFIIGVGKIVDLAKFEEFRKKMNFSEYNVRVHSTKELINTTTRYNNFKVKNTTLEVCSFSGTTVSTKIDPTKDELFVVTYLNNDEGDEGFLNDDGDDIDYDIDPSFFSESQQTLLSLDEKVGVVNYESAFGAARNG
jgi:hypothetical protein